MSREEACCPNTHDTVQNRGFYSPMFLTCKIIRSRPPREISLSNELLENESHHSPSWKIGELAITLGQILGVETCSESGYVLCLGNKHSYS